ncbi:TetR family transcriptional regulator [Chitinimonas lacunae]|uniref:TetR family transcriptional regulator n=1 Tax=Chitinimonas lacunae TaxID=1963018 RepID=A0ABV8MMI6_9NEIS
METREQLLDAAEQVFLDKGVARATLDDIARAAGMTRGAIYWHFKNKAELFTAMCERVMLPMQSVLAALADDPGDDPVGRLSECGANVLRQVATDAHTQRVFEIFMFKTEFNEEVAAVLEREAENARRCYNQLITILSAAQRCGQLPAHLNCAAAAFLFNSMMTGVIREWLEWRNFDLAAHALWLWHTCVAGLRHGPPFLANSQQ